MKTAEALIIQREDAENFAAEAVARLRTELALHSPRCIDPEHGIGWRIKSPLAIERKLSGSQLGRQINDFIGIRVLASHVGMLGIIESKTDLWSLGIGLQCMKRENTFAKPDVSGYRSIHLDYVFSRPSEWKLTTEATVELQVTTWLQHFHGALSHQLYYKAETPPSPSLMTFLQELSGKVEAIDREVERAAGGSAARRRPEGPT